MFEQTDQDANPANNQCLLVDNLITCAESGILTSREIRATLDSLSSHIAECGLCKQNFMLSDIFDACLGQKEVYVFIKGNIGDLHDRRNIC